MGDNHSQFAKQAGYVWIAAVLLCVASSLFMMDFVPDDSYISFRYAENFANGHGLTFNTNEPPVEGFSNFLWILLCAAMYLAGLNLPAAMPVVGILLGIGGITLLWLLLLRRGLPPFQMLFPLLILASSGPFILYEVSGMETPLFACLLLLTLIWLDRIFSTGRLVYYLLTAATGVLLALCRPEGILVFPIVSGYVFLASRRPNQRLDADVKASKNIFISLTAFAVVIALYHVWRVNYFGEWLPTPFLSKGGGGKSLVFAWAENFKYYFVKQMRYYPPVGYYFVALLVFSLVGGWLSRSVSALRRTERVAIVLAVGYSLIYLNFKDWMPGMRYHSAFVGVMLLPAAHLATRFFEAAKEKRNIWMIGMTAVVLNFGVLAQLRMIAERTETSNRLCTVPLGKWLKNVVPEGSLMVVSDVGAIPYYSGLHAVDFHPESLTDLYIAKNGFSIDYIRRRDPDVVIFPSQSIYVAKFYPEHYKMAMDRRFDKYRLIGVSRYDWDNDRCYWVYVRSNFPELTDEQFENFPHGVGSVMRKYR